MPVVLVRLELSRLHRGQGRYRCAMPAPPEPFEIRIKVPDDVMRKVQIEDFVAKDLLSRIPPDA